MKGNQQKTRKALAVIYDWILKAGYVYGYPDTRQKRRQLYDMMIKALSAKPRNCDIGTLTEQQQRFSDFCKKMQHTDKACCGGCPIVHLRMKGVISNSCELAWAQMPYEKGKE